jgi:TonB family protein
MPRLTRSSAIRAALLAAALLLAAAPARAQGADGPDTQPELLNARNMTRITSRAYPAEVRGRRAPATVSVHMKILADGSVDSSSVSIVTSPDPLFNTAAAKVAVQMRFRPATLGGAPVPVWVTVPVTFARGVDRSGDSRDVQRDERPMRENLPPPRP